MTVTMGGSANTAHAHVGTTGPAIIVFIPAMRESKSKPRMILCARTSRRCPGTKGGEEARTGASPPPQKNLAARIGLKRSTRLCAEHLSTAAFRTNFPEVCATPLGLVSRGLQNTKARGPEAPPMTGQSVNARLPGRVKSPAEQQWVRNPRMKSRAHRHTAPSCFFTTVPSVS